MLFFTKHGMENIGIKQCIADDNYSGASLERMKIPSDFNRE
ncbi:hypothetical protein LDG_7211 [Legionella drancourtii LLAP12]|uniref:Uncharacterized protein n=1 Tax=Legionella drancourtii LLAP12 TaxID=658187 RepID=G9EPK9_9GAMM|nr:hypothetical protein LDG_7211 [Legionella drancourtii LLAP12]